jgi:Ca2+-binding RTX toxin-like protein
VASIDSKILLPATILGGGGSDELTGGGGDDDLDGGVGADQLTGGPGGIFHQSMANDDLTDFGRQRRRQRAMSPGRTESTAGTFVFNGTENSDSVISLSIPQDATKIIISIDDVPTSHDATEFKRLPAQWQWWSRFSDDRRQHHAPATINGGAGADQIGGGGGDDQIDGGTEDDLMYGGPGADFFKDVEATETPADFNANEGDTKTDAATSTPQGEEIVVTGTTRTTSSGCCSTKRTIRNWYLYL